jgi:hypothetical protein
VDIDNPYAPPRPEPVRHTEAVDDGLVRRPTRFAAAFRDGLIGPAIYSPPMNLLGFWGYMKRRQDPPPGLTFGTGAIGFLARGEISASVCRAAQPNSGPPIFLRCRKPDVMDSPQGRLPR